MSGLEIPLILAAAGGGIGAATSDDPLKGLAIGAGLGGLGGLGAGLIPGLAPALGLGQTAGATAAGGTAAMTGKQALTGLQVGSTGLGTAASLAKTPPPPKMMDVGIPSPAQIGFQPQTQMSLPDFIAQIASQGSISPAPTI